MGNLAALEHNVHHHEECAHTFEGAAVAAKGDGKDLASAATAKGDRKLQIAVMIRCDVFRELRARQIKPHAWPCGILPRRELHRGPALGRCPRGAP